MEPSTNCNQLEQEEDNTLLDQELSLNPPTRRKTNSLPGSHGPLGVDPSNVSCLPDMLSGAMDRLPRTLFTVHRSQLVAVHTWLSLS